MGDSQEHLLCCPGYATIREGKELSKNVDLVGYYREILRVLDDKLVKWAISRIISHAVELNLGAFVRVDVQPILYTCSVMQVF